MEHFPSAVNKDRRLAVVGQEIVNHQFAQVRNPRLLGIGSARTSRGRQSRKGQDNFSQGRPNQARLIIVSSIELPFAVQGRKQGREFPHGFGRPQEQDALRVEGIVEQGKKPLLRLSVQIDQQVAATDQIEPRKGWIFKHILFREDQEIANYFLSVVKSAVPIQGEEA